ncbi:MAG: DUF3332 domain-containing protein [Melioribacteraceae bacterium]|nr:DUF3332 domain-containing protein [Melioribacteraceae bacterium]MCF8265742.1 DUF3332 domain-containing protein [Melioribacteraceae bacterium]MCF8432313.1 DUF3332 domain-containing protein [Melioribacteraceae bacterium]
MKKLKAVVALLLISSFMYTSIGCYGSFNLTKKLYNWNGTVGDKFVNEVVFLAFLIVPVYEATTIIDAFILNAIEFWTGNNPVNLANGEKETQIVVGENSTYEITYSQNSIKINCIDGNEKGQNAEFFYSGDEQSWYLNSGDNSIKIAQILNKSENEIIVNYFLPNGDIIELNQNNLNSTALKLKLDLYNQLASTK